MPEGKSEIPDEIMRKAADALLAAGHSVRIGDEAHLSIAKALLAEREAEHARCNAILKAAFGAHITVDALEASIATKWQPIETAPLDGTLVDLWAYRGECGKSGIRPAERYADCRFAKNSYGTEPYGEPRWQGLNDRYITVTPTHWMPIPSGPPSTEENLQHD